MIATTEYMFELCNKFNITIYTARESPTEAFIQWYNDNKDKCYGKIRVGDFDAETVFDLFDDDLNTLWKEDV